MLNMVATELCFNFESFSLNCKTLECFFCSCALPALFVLKKFPQFLEFDYCADDDFILHFKLWTREVEELANSYRG